MLTERSEAVPSLLRRPHGVKFAAVFCTVDHVLKTFSVSSSSLGSSFKLLSFNKLKKKKKNIMVKTCRGRKMPRDERPRTDTAWYLPASPWKPPAYSPDLQPIPPILTLNPPAHQGRRVSDTSARNDTCPAGMEMN